MIYYCQHCSKSFKSQGSLNKHIPKMPACFLYYDQQSNPSSNSRYIRNLSRSPDQSNNNLPTDTVHYPINDTFTDLEDGGQDAPSLPNLQQSYTRPYDGEVAHVFGSELTFFEQLKKAREDADVSAHYPFLDEEEWNLAKWLLRRTNQAGIDEFLKLKITTNRTQPAFTNKRSFFRTIDMLPEGTGWTCSRETIQGDKLGPNGQLMTEDIELWLRNPVECVKELMGNVAFKDVMSYVPEMVYKDEEGNVRIYDEMWTGDWWWNLQKKLPVGAVVTPIILSSDKTKLTDHRGDKAAWPVYLTIGNISKDIRRLSSSYSSLLLGYIPVQKLDCFTDATRSEANYAVFHHCMKLLTAPLIKAGTDGVRIICADGCIRHCFLILAAYIADHPEQTLVVCCQDNYCPKCLVHFNDRGNPVASAARNPVETADILLEYTYGRKVNQFETQGLRGGLVQEPFWKHLPNCDIFACITPDILHQLHKGIFKDHLVKWCCHLTNRIKHQIDERFKLMPHTSGLRHFSKGISFLTQTTGYEHKEMEKVFLGVMAGICSSDVLVIVRSLLDFIYLAQYKSITDKTLDGMDRALGDFHAFKHVLIDLEIREHFNIPKFHSLIHYTNSIRLLGSLDGYNTELPERLHIDYAKKAYRASNKRDYTIQMMTWLRRQEAVNQQESFLSYIRQITSQEAQFKGVNADEMSGSEVNDEHPAEVHQQEKQPFPGIFAARSTVSSSPSAYYIAIKPPLSSISVEVIQNMYGATNFITTLNNFLQQFTNVQHAQYSTANVRDRHVNDVKRIHRLQAHPIQPAKDIRHSPTPARFDTALIIENAELHKSEGGIHGLRVAQIHAIFKLPEHLGIHKHPLVFISWFRPFTHFDRTKGMYRLQRSSVRHQPHTQIVTADQIYRGCHLIPLFGANVDPTWTAENVFDNATVFYFNHYIDHYVFDLIYSSVNGL